MTFHAQGIRFGDLVRYFSEKANVTIVCDQTLADVPLTVAIQDQPFDDALRLACRLVEADINRVGNAYAIGTTRSSDKIPKIFRMRGDPEAVQGALDAVGVGKQAQIRKDGTVLVVGTSDEIRRAENVLAMIADTQPGQWHVQLFLVTLTNRDLSDLGLDITPSAGVQASIAAPGVSTVKANAGLNVVLRAARERSSVSVAARPEFILMDGGKGNFTRGAEVLIPKRAVSGQGTITTTEFERIQSGTTVNVDGREVSPDVIQLNLQVQLSDLREITSEGTPVTDRRSFTDTALAAHGSDVLLGSFELTSERKSNGHWLRSGTFNDSTYEILQVWARVTYLGTPTPSAAACDRD